MNRRALQIFVSPPEARLRCAAIDDQRALDRVVEILARLVRAQQAVRP